MHADLQRLLAEDLLAEFRDIPMARLRTIRSELTAAEGDVSLVRRVAQGRMDIVGHEVDRRAHDGPPTEGAAHTGSATAAEAAAIDPSAALLYDLPDILADASGGPRRGGARPSDIVEPGPVALSLIEALDEIAAPGRLAKLSGLGGADLGDLFEGLREFEVELSSVRRGLHDRIDTIQGEIARRYRDGEASVDALLQ